MKTLELDVFSAADVTGNTPVPPGTRFRLAESLFDGHDSLRDVKLPEAATVVDYLRRSPVPDTVTSFTAVKWHGLRRHRRIVVWNGKPVARGHSMNAAA